MANPRVIHGEGKPRLVKVPTSVLSDTVSAGSSTSVTFTTGGYDDGQVIGKIIITVDENGDSIYGICTAYNGLTEVATVSEWLGGDADANIPFAGQDITIGGDAVDLPYCYQLTERFTLDAIQKRLSNGNVVTKKRGWYYSATLDYSPHLTKADFQTWEDLLDITESDFYFYPRRDNPNIYYRVTYPADYTLEFAQKKHHMNHKLVIIQLIGTRRLTDIDLTTDAGYTEFGYGDNYSDGLYQGA